MPYLPNLSLILKVTSVPYLVDPARDVVGSRREDHLCVSNVTGQTNDAVLVLKQF